MRKYVFLFIIMNLIWGCATSIAILPIKPEATYFIEPELAKINTVYIGETMLKEGNYKTIKVLKLLKEFGNVPTTGILAATYHPKGDYKLIGKFENWIVYQHDNSFWYGTHESNPQILEDNNGNLFLRKKSNNKPLSITEVERSKIIVKEYDNFMQELIYTGLENNVIKFSYREFVNDMARPAFTLNPTYNKDDKKIRFKGAFFEILECNNQSITYKILSGFKSKTKNNLNE